MKRLMETIQLRPSAPSSLPDDQPPTANNHVIIFKHLDKPNGGLHAGTAVLARTLVACNAWNGYLTIERDGPRLDLLEDDVLPAGEHYFHVPRPSTTPSTTSTAPPDAGDHYKYPVYPSFQHWAFPHRQIPIPWCGQIESDTLTGATTNTPSISSVGAAVINRDKSCVVSKYRDYIERAHFVRVTSLSGSAKMA
ncbi:hypothetical protein CC80DRAFT_557889 [Byssothecium circinans]|uniref:Uncharacterized protein n=1 Tax=Byssothecium circinans TaxID=147558 RepID=A0A6A5U3V6_9PLEO|nr:hypothetical protein CC80DRAFT_557889 [Byssothecium circinans]